MDDREELAALRRLAELEARAGGGDPYSFKNLAGAAVEPNLSMLSGMATTPIAGLAGIAGTLLPGPEGQGANWARNVSDVGSYSPRTEGGRTATEAISYPFRKLGEGADYLGGKTSELTGSPALGAAVNAGVQVGVPLAIAKGASVAAAKDTVPGKLGKWLMQKAAKPAVTDLESGAGDRAIQTMLDEGISPTRGGMIELSKRVAKLNQQVEKAVGASTGEVNVGDIGQKYLDQYSKAVMQANPEADLGAVSNTWQQFQRSPLVANQDTIPVQLAHQLKRGTQQAVGSKAYGEMGTAATEAQKAIARHLREGVAEQVPEAVAPLARESALMNVRDVAERRTLMQGNANPAGLAALRLDNPLSALSFLADRSAAAKALAARLLYGIGNPNLARAVMTGAMVNQEQQ